VSFNLISQNVVASKRKIIRGRLSIDIRLFRFVPATPEAVMVTLSIETCSAKFFIKSTQRLILSECDFPILLRTHNMVHMSTIIDRNMRSRGPFRAKNGFLSIRTVRGVGTFAKYSQYRLAIPRRIISPKGYPVELRSLGEHIRKRRRDLGFL
jgi:hypothetical protein